MKIWVLDLFIENQRSLQGASSNLIDEMRKNDREKYYNFMRMDPETFDTLLNLVPLKIEKHNFLRESVSAKIRLELTIRYLALGDSMMSISYLFRVGKNTVSEILAETCQAIWDSLKEVFLKPSQDNWKKVAEKYETKWNFKNCLGAVDEKHIIMQAPPNSGSNFYNYKGSHSINLLGIADANYKFIMIDIEAEGRKRDSGIFRNSQLGQGFEQKLFNVPSPDPVNNAICFGYEAFLLTSYVMRPYPRREDLDMRQKVFNYRLSRPRRVVESAFGILAAVWRIFRKPIIASEATVRKILQASVCLLNFLLLHKGSGSTRHECSDKTVQAQGIIDFQRSGSNMYAREASQIREHFADYFCGLDSVEQKALCNDF